MKTFISKHRSKISALLVMAMSSRALAGVPDMVRNLETAVLEIIAPLFCIGGVVFMGIRLAMGDEGAKKGLLWSCFGTVVAFTGPSILSYLQNHIAS